MNAEYDVLLVFVFVVLLAILVYGVKYFRCREQLLSHDEDDKCDPITITHFHAEDTDLLGFGDPTKPMFILGTNLDKIKKFLFVSLSVAQWPSLNSLPSAKIVHVFTDSDFTIETNPLNANIQRINFTLPASLHTRSKTPSFIVACDECTGDFVTSPQITNRNTTPGCDPDERFC